MVVGHMREVLVVGTTCTMRVVSATTDASHSRGGRLVWGWAMAVHVGHRVWVVRGGVGGSVWILRARRWRVVVGSGV